MAHSTRDKIIYFTTTGIVAAVMLWSAVNFSLNPEMKGAFVHLGLPSWFRSELSIAKFLGTIALLVPGLPALVTLFAYCGFAITTSSAFIAHLSSGDGFLRSAEPLIFLGLLVVSYLYHPRLRARA